MSAMSVVLVDDPAANRHFDLRRTLERRGAWRLAARVVPADMPVPAYRVGDPDATRAPALALAAALDELVRRVPPPFAVVVFVSLATLPFVEALHLDPRSRPLLKIGV